MGKNINPLYRVFFPGLLKKNKFKDPRLVNKKEIRGENDSLISLLDKQGNAVVSKWGRISTPADDTFETKHTFNIPGGNTVSSCRVIFPNGKTEVSLKVSEQHFTSDGTYTIHFLLELV